MNAQRGGEVKTEAEIEAVLRACGLDFDLVTMQRPGEFAVDKRVRVRVDLSDGSACSYDVLARIAAKLGTTDISFGYEKEHEYSDVTFEPSRAWLAINLAEASMIYTEQEGKTP